VTSVGTTIGVDVGGTKVAAGVVDEQGRVLLFARKDTPVGGDRAQTEKIVVDVVGELRLTHDVDAIGIGAAGFVGADRATVLFAPNLAWRHEPLR